VNSFHFKSFFWKSFRGSRFQKICYVSSATKIETREEKLAIKLGLIVDFTKKFCRQISNRLMKRLQLMLLNPLHANTFCCILWIDLFSNWCAQLFSPSENIGKIVYSRNYAILLAIRNHQFSLICSDEKSFKVHASTWKFIIENPCFFGNGKCLVYYSDSLKSQAWKIKN